MAQSAADSRKTPLHIDAFWEKPTIAPPLSWDKWTQQWKLALLVKEEIHLETLINGPPSAVTYPPEPTLKSQWRTTRRQPRESGKSAISN